jgi:hypothetical protein
MNLTKTFASSLAHRCHSPELRHHSLQWLDYVSSQEHLPQTISTSYADDEQTGALFYSLGWHTLTTGM